MAEARLRNYPADPTCRFPDREEDENERGHPLAKEAHSLFRFYSAAEFF